MFICTRVYVCISVHTCKRFARGVWRRENGRDTPFLNNNYMCIFSSLLMFTCSYSVRLCSLTFGLCGCSMIMCSLHVGLCIEKACVCEHSLLVCAWLQRVYMNTPNWFMYNYSRCMCSLPISLAIIIAFVCFHSLSVCFWLKICMCSPIVGSCKIKTSVCVFTPSQFLFVYSVCLCSFPVYTSMFDCLSVWTKSLYLYVRLFVCADEESIPIYSIVCLCGRSLYLYVRMFVFADEWIIPQYVWLFMFAEEEIIPCTFDCLSLHMNTIPICSTVCFPTYAG